MKQTRSIIYSILILVCIYFIIYSQLQINLVNALKSENTALKEEATKLRYDMHSLNEYVLKSAANSRKAQLEAQRVSGELESCKSKK